MEDSALRIHEIERGVSKVTEALNQRNPEFASQVAAMDENVGRLMQKLEDLGVANETIVIFTSDQGSMCTSRRMVSSQKPYSMGKSFLYEGGIRAPLVVKWPGQIEASSTNETVTLNTDLYPTVLDILDLPLRPEQHKDGISLKPALKGDHIPFDRVFRWAYPPRHALGHVTSTAIRKGNYKLIYWYRHGGKTELYNVVEDVGESRDLSEGMPEKREAMLSELNEPDYMSPFRP